MASINKKKYQIAVTHFPKHEHSLDFIRGIPYNAKDNVMLCKSREMTLDDMKEVNPDAVSVPGQTFILQDINGNDLIIKSDMIKDLSMIDAYIIEHMSIRNLTLYVSAEKFEIDNKTYAMLSYKDSNNSLIVAKISDVDIWFTE